MTETPTYRPIVTNSEELPVLPKVTLWDWVKYYAFNLYRKPLVWKRQRQLCKLSEDLKVCLDQELLSVIRKNISVCDACRDTLVILKPQIFLSQIKMILTKFYCTDHGSMYTDFYKKHEDKFKQSEEIARWINNL